MKIKTEYVCTECGNITSKWFGKCPGCGEWNTLEENEVSASVPAKSALNKNSYTLPVREKSLSFPINSISITEEPRSKTGIGEFDRVLGGGIVKGSVTLLSGEPGIGKSTLLLQICGVLSDNFKLLYVSGEESPSQIKLRAKRLNISNDNILLYTETDINEILSEAGVSFIALSADLNL